MTYFTIANGYLVQAFEPRTDAYRGAAAGGVWPLDERLEPIARDLTARTREWFPSFDRSGRMALWVSPSPVFAQEYARACTGLGIPVRILLCHSDRQEPQAETPLLSCSQLGWEIVSASFDYSLIEDEIIEEDPQLGPFVRRLNQARLFDSREALQEFLRAREDLVAMGENLESLENMIPVLLGECRLEA